MPEGRTYVCKWQKLEDGTYRGIVKRPKLHVEADSLDDLVVELTEQIADANGDCEPQIDFEPPVAAGGKKDWFRDKIVSLTPSSHFAIENFDNIIEGGYCKRCKYPLGKRNSEAIIVDSMWPGGASNSWDTNANGLNVLLMSEELLESFSKSERKMFDVREVKVPAGKRKKFVEVVPKHVVPQIVIKSLRVDGWRCKVCGQVEFNHGRELGWCVMAIARDGLPKDEVFFVGTSTDYNMCLRPATWERLKAVLRKATMTSDPVAVVEAHQIAKRVVLPPINNSASS
jgi:hypothetical protein